LQRLEKYLVVGKEKELGRRVDQVVPGGGAGGEDKSGQNGSGSIFRSHPLKPPEKKKSRRVTEKGRLQSELENLVSRPLKMKEEVQR